MNANGIKTLIVLAALFSSSACESEITRTATATASGEDDISVVFDDGISASNISEYEAIVAANPELVTERHSFELTVSATDGASVTVGKFKIKLYVSSDYLAGCINQKMPHLVLQVTTSAAALALVEVHLAGWFNGKTPCIGLFNKSVIAYGYCLKGCFSNPKNGVKTSVKNGLIAAGVSGSIATIISSLATPVLIPALGI